MLEGTRVPASPYQGIAGSPAFRDCALQLLISVSSFSALPPPGRRLLFAVSLALSSKPNTPANKRTQRAALQSRNNEDIGRQGERACYRARRKKDTRQKHCRRIAQARVISYNDHARAAGGGCSGARRGRPKRETAAAARKQRGWAAYGPRFMQGPLGKKLLSFMHLPLFTRTDSSSSFPFFIFQISLQLLLPNITSPAHITILIIYTYGNFHIQNKLM